MNVSLLRFKKLIRLFSFCAKWREEKKKKRILIFRFSFFFFFFFAENRVEESRIGEVHCKELLIILLHLISFFLGPRVREYNSWIFVKHLNRYRVL